MLACIGRIPLLRQRLLLLAGCAVLYGMWLMWVPLTEIDEARYTEATRYMLQSHDFLIPHFNGAPRYQKPILYYWLQAGSMRLFGVNETAARLPSAVVSLVLVLLVHAFLLRWLVPWVSAERRDTARGAVFLGAVALATMPLLAIWAHSAVTDPTLTLFISGSLLALLQAELEGAAGASPQQLAKWYYLAAASAALAFLTKGPVGVVLPAIGWLCYHLRQRSLRSETARIPWLGAIALFLLIAAPWYVATYFVDGPGFLKHFFLVENIGRATATMEEHGSTNRLLNLLTYLPVSLLLLFPYSPFLLRDLIAPIQAQDVIEADLYKRMRRFAWTWLVGIIAIFSLSKTQLPSYIQAISGAAAILFVLHLFVRLTSVPSPSRRLKIAGILEVGLLILVGILYTGGIAFLLSKPSAVQGPLDSLPLAHQTVLITIVLLAICGLLFVIGVVLGSLRWSAERYVGWVMGAWAIAFAVIILLAGPLAVRRMYVPSAAMGYYLRDHSNGLPVFFYTKNMSESVVFYARQIIRFNVNDNEQSLIDLRTRLRPYPEVTLITDQKGLPQIEQCGTIHRRTPFGSLLILDFYPINGPGAP